MMRTTITVTNTHCTGGEREKEGGENGEEGVEKWDNGDDRG